jgi:hypothetical protein
MENLSQLNLILVKRSTKMTKSYDSSENIRLNHLKRAINNDELEDDNCPNCFFSLKDLQENINNCKTTEELEKIKYLIECIKKSCKLKKTDKNRELLNEFFCRRCNNSYIGEFELIAQNHISEVLSFYKYDNERISERDIYNFPIVAKDHNLFIAEIWGDSGIRLRRDSWVSVRYSEELNSSQSSVTHQRTDRHEILG